jgi:hypothetical protein
MSFESVGDSTCGHKHTFDHQTVFIEGTFHIKANDKTYKVTSPSVFITKAGIVHEIIAQTPNAKAMCVHALRKDENIEDIASPEEIAEGLNENTTHTLIEGGVGETFYKQPPRALKPLE